MKIKHKDHSKPNAISIKETIWFLYLRLLLILKFKGQTSVGTIRSRPSTPVPNVSPDCVYGSISSLPSRRSTLTPPVVKRSYQPSPAAHRHNWMLRHASKNKINSTGKQYITHRRNWKMSLAIKNRIHSKGKDHFTLRHNLILNKAAGIG